jgi:outer membrane protein OmpA-like peptidoglycan-associated protein
VEARQAYQNADHAEETKYAPSSLLEARQALDKAEATHKDNPQSNEERSAAYIAHRKADLAVIEGRILQERAQRQALEKRHDQLQEMRRLSAEQQLGVTQDEVKNLSTQLQTQNRQANAKLNEVSAELQRERERAQRALASLEKVAQVKEEARGTVLTLSGQVLFLTGKSELLPAATDQLQLVAQAILDQDDERPIVVEGHTDSRGSESMNMQLSQDRADAVRSFLIQQGVPASRVKAVGRGEGSPVATNDTPEGRANNRRVEIVLGAPQPATAQAPQSR